MTFEEYRRYDATALARLVREKETSPSELLELAVGRAQAVNPIINAIVHPLYERAGKMAEEADPDAAFSGVPFLLKDLGLELKGAPFSQGCRAFSQYISQTESVLVGRLRKAGLLFMGKTNTPEFGLTPYTEPRAFGPTRNPWNTERSAGGSSGGSAAAVAAGITPFATASDGGGSIRIPASCCGLFGLKPSTGRNTLAPQTDYGWQGGVAEHCVSRSVRDSAALLDAIHGEAPGERFALSPPRKPYLQEVQTEPGILRIGWSTRHPLGHSVDGACKAAVTHSAGLLESLGHQVEEVPLPFYAEDLIESFIFMIMGETSALVAEMGQKLGRPARRTDVEPSTWTLFLLGKTISSDQFILAMRRWNTIARRMGDFHQDFDLLMTPVAARRPFSIGELQPSSAEQRLIDLVNRFGLGSIARRKVGQLADKVFSYIPWTPLANITGQPSMSVPLYWTDEEQLPIGTLFTAPFGREDLLFQLAGQLERAQPWFDRVPTI